MINKKIIFISHGLNIGGAEKFLISLANYLSEKFIVEIVAISPGRDLLGELSNEVTFKEIKRVKKFDIKTIIELHKYLSKNKNAIVCNMDFFCFFYYRLSTIFLKSNNNTFISYHSTILKNRKENILTWIYTRFLRKRDCIITVSENQAKYTANKFGLNFSMFKTIHNGIDVSKWENNEFIDFKKQIRERYNIPFDSKVIVITAALREEKNHILAIEALNYFHHYYKSKPYLLLVGDGEMRNQIKSQIEKFDIMEYVVFAGSQSNVKPFYYASDIFSLTSFSETFSIAVLEAMSSGLPCVITNTGGANEMVKDGFNGFLSEINPVSVAECWNKAFNYDFSNELIKNNVIDRFDVLSMVNKYNTIFDK